MYSVFIHTKLVSFNTNTNQIIFNWLTKVVPSPYHRYGSRLGVELASGLNGPVELINEVLVRRGLAMFQD